jgi:hypothetical protein
MKLSPRQAKTSTGILQAVNWVKSVNVSVCQEHKAINKKIIIIKIKIKNKNFACT